MARRKLAPTSNLRENTMINEILHTTLYPFINIAGTAHGIVEYYGRALGVL